MKKLKKIPIFKTAAQEKKFWAEHDSTDFIDWNQAKTASFPHLKPSTETISIRLPASLLSEIRTLANKDDIPYQSLMKMILIQGLQQFKKIP